MKKATEYRVHALECRALASQAGTAEHRRQLISMAETWDSLADDRDRNINGLPDKTRPEKVQ